MTDAMEEAMRDTLIHGVGITGPDGKHVPLSDFYLPPEPEGVALETTAEEREAYAKAAETELVWPEGGFVGRLLRDFDRLSAEIASLKARLAEAEAEKAEAVKAEREAIASWYERVGWLIDENDIAALIRARGGSDER